MALIGTVSSEGLHFRNRIINGDMRIAQRGTAALTVNSTSGFYAVDRFQARGQSSDGVFTVQQVSDSPAGFEYSLKATVTTVDSSLTSGQFYYIRYMCEGYDVADLDWGTADAKTVTLSFWVKSSLTGTFGGVIPNVDLDRSYPFTYTISAANTWEYKTITIPGDTTGTWNKTNSIGLRVIYALGAGSDISGTAGVWAAANYQGGATGQTQVISTLNATWQVTGVQLEVGSVATPFERRPFRAELALCQRYFQKSTAVVGYANGSATIQAMATFLVEMRATPTLTNTGTVRITDGAVNSTSTSNPSSTFGTATGTAFNMSGFTANLTAYRPFIQDGAGGDSFAYSAEL